MPINHDKPITLRPTARFVPQGTSEGEPASIFLNLETDIVFTWGLTASVFRCECTSSDLFPLKSRQGKIILRWDEDSKNPREVVLDQVTIVDVEPGQLGIPWNKDNPESSVADLNQKRVQSITCSLSIADFRLRFAPPKGGLLELGDFNTPPLDYIKQIDSRKRKLYSNTDLLRECLKAMRYSVVDELKKISYRTAYIPSTVDDFPKFENVSWRGVPAVEELQRILKAIGHIIAPYTNGGLRIIRDGLEPDPEFDKYTVLSVIEDSALDIRPTRIVISSAPTAISEVKDYRGIDDSGFQYVWRDVSDGKYKLQDEIPYLKGLDLIDQYRNGWPNVGTVLVNGQEIKVGDLYDKTGWSRIRLNPEKFPHVSFFSQNPDPSKGYVMPTLYAKAMRFDRKSGLWLQGKEFIQMKLVSIHGNGTVLATEKWLLNIDQEKCSIGNFQDHLKLLGPGDVVARLAHDAFDTAENKPLFFHIGFEGVRESFRVVEEESSIEALDAEIVISRPELHLIRLNGEDQNREELQARAVQHALAYLPPKQNVGYTVTILGWENIQLSPRISKVVWTKNMHTVVHVDAFGSLRHRPSQRERSWIPDKPSDAATRDSKSIDTSDKEVVYLDNGGNDTNSGGELIYVKLVQSGGSDGGLSTKPSYRYIVRDGDDNVLGQDVIPAWQRSNGSHLPAEIGIARLKSDGSVMLLLGDEVPNTGECDLD